MPAPADNVAVAKMLASVAPMLWMLVMRYLPRADWEDGHAALTLYTIERVIPTHDPGRGSKFSNYVWRCCHSFLFDRLRRRRLPIAEMPPELHDPRTNHTLAVAALVDRIAARPGEFLNATDAETLRHVLQRRPGESPYTAVRRQCHTNPAIAARRVRSLRAALLALPVEDLIITPPDTSRVAADLSR